MLNRSIRSLFHTFIIITFSLTLIFRVMLGFLYVARDPPLPLFNSTLLTFASIDVTESLLNKEVNRLLDGGFGNRRHRTFLSSGKPIVDVRVRSAKGIQINVDSPKFYRIWLKFRRQLQKWKTNRRFELDFMMNNAVRVSGRKYKSCAVVGNSGILLKKKFGNLIDNHETVIRLNNARIASFRLNVGSKTSISFVNSNILHLCARKEGCFCHPYGTNVPIVMYMCQPVHFLDYAFCNSSNKSPLVVTDPRFDVLCARIVKYYSAKRFVEKTGKDVKEWNSAHDAVNFHYSSGMQAVMLALGNCDTVSIFGFGKSASAKHHYHSNQKSELRLHDYEAEYDFYYDLVHRPQVIPFISSKFKFPPVVIYQ